ncbi:MAG: hypothetical protein ACKOBC_01110 [Hyphomicrobiales bacterium]|jgi:hypothetical protein|nr:hypothetical protein [Hyphomicrobiales bacterium]NBR11134.1 hypothetical protein [Alphaproteobacteria bacterium]
MAKRGINFKNLLTLVSVAILVGVEFLGVAVAAGWALAGLFGLSQTLETVLMTAFGALGVYALFVFMRRAVTVEPVRG